MANIYDMADTWTAVGTTYTALKMNVTDTASAAASLLMDLQVGGTSRFNVGKAGAFTSKPTANSGMTAIWDTYAFGYSLKLSGNNSIDNRLELYLGNASNPTVPELSVRHNGNNLGAIIQARNAADDDGIFLSFVDATYPFVRWGNAGPYLIKDSAGILVMRNYATPGEAQQLRIANTWTAGGVQEYLRLGAASNRFVVRATGAGGGVQRPLDLDGSAIQFQTGGTLALQINSAQLFQFLGTTSAFPALKRSSTVLQARLADDSDFAPLQGNLRTQANAVPETPVATHTMIITDAGGTAYRVLCVV